MDTSFIQSLFTFLTNNIFSIIFIFAIIETFLVINIFMMMRRHETVLLDVSDNLLKGFKDAPDKDSLMSPHEKIEGTLDWIRNKISLDPGSKAFFAKNANSIGQRSFFTKHYKLEIFASLMSTLVQVFPLLGILGTILAIAQSAIEGGGDLDVAALSSAFVLAMDTTILGIGFSIIFMLVESTFQPKIERVINESGDYKQIITKIHMS